LVENTSRDVGIAFANELSTICEELGVDVYEVIRLANRHPRVNVLALGHCIPIDPWFLVENTKAGEFVRLPRAINDQRAVDVANKVIEQAKKQGYQKLLFWAWLTNLMSMIVVKHRRSL
jgi:UDP-N-acetylglucosamine 2-epimerase (non-hydrolysing)